MANVLVAYASKYGSTGEVAEAIARRLSALGVNAEARPADKVRDLTEYSAVVLGVALYFFRWRHEGHSFCTRNRRALTSLPVALFGMGPIEDTPEQYAAARARLDKGLTKHPWLAPRSIVVFGGQLDPAKLRFPDNNPGMRHTAPCDLRDWAAIDAWADGLVDALAIDAEPSQPES